MSPAVPLFALAVAGALAGLWADWPLAAPVLVALSSGALAALCPAKIGRALLVVVFTCAATAAAATALRLEHAQLRAALPVDEPVVLEGRVRDAAPTRSGGWRWLLDVDGLLEGPPHKARPRALAVVVEVRLSRAAAGVYVEPGDRVRVRGRLSPLKPADAPGRFDEEQFGLARGIHARLGLYDAADLAVVRRGEEAAPLAKLRLSLRERLLDLATPKEAGVLLALLVGDTALFDREDLELYRRVGAGHLLAVSGLQVSLLALLGFRAVLFALLLLPWGRVRLRARGLSALSSLALVWAFVGLCGAPPSAVRAAGMATAGLVALSFGRRARALDTFAIAGLVTVLLSPASVIDPSFLLSYAAVLGLVAVQSPRGLAARLGALGKGALSALAAGLATLPISAHLFGEVAPGGILANIVLVPAASLLQVPAIALGLLGALFASPWMVSLGAAAGGVLEALCAGLDGFLGGVVPLTAPGPAETALLLVASLLFVVGAARGPSRGLLAAAAASAALALLPSLSSPGGVRVTVLPVGQGDGLVLEMDSGEVMLVDGGGLWDERRDPGVDVVLPFLRRRGIARVDVVVLSHPHPDHLLGLLPVVEQVPVGELWHSGYGEGHPLMRRLLTTAARRGVKVRAAPELVGAHRFGATRVEVLAPFPEDGDALYEELSENDNSLVLRVVHGRDRLLLTGDIERWGETYLLASGVDVSADVVKAAHHGSRTSSTDAFVRATGAKHVVFTTEARNGFGFPHAPVVERWRRSGASLWDTAVHGEISIWLTGEGVSIEPHRAPERSGTAPVSPPVAARGERP